MSSQRNMLMDMLYNNMDGESHMDGGSSNFFNFFTKWKKRNKVPLGITKDQLNAYQRQAGAEYRALSKAQKAKHGSVKAPAAKAKAKTPAAKAKTSKVSGRILKKDIPVNKIIADKILLGSLVSKMLKKKYPKLEGGASMKQYNDFRMSTGPFRNKSEETAAWKRYQTADASQTMNATEYKAYILGSMLYDYAKSI